MSIFNETFTALDNTLLTALSPAWDAAANTEVLSNRLSSTSASGFSASRPPTAPTTADQQVSFLCKANGAGSVAPGVALRLDAAGNNGYLAYYAAGWRIRKILGGVVSQIGVTSAVNPATTERSCVFSVIGSTLTLTIDSVDVLVETDTDISAISQWGVFTYFSDAGTARYIDTLNYSDVAVSRSITDIDTDNDVQAGQSSVTIAGTLLDAAPVTQTATLGGQPLTITNWNSGSPIVDIPLHINLRWGQVYQLDVTDDTGTVSLAGVTLSAATGWEQVTYDGSTPPVGDVGFVSQALADLGITMAAGDSWMFESATGMTVALDGSVVVDPPVTITGSYKVWDVSAGGYSALSSYTFEDAGAIVSQLIGQAQAMSRFIFSRVFGRVN